MGAERLNQMQNPALSIKQALQDYRRKGYSDDWINMRLNSIEIKKELVNVVYDYIELCLEDGLVTKEELSTVKKMRLFFGIEEGDSYKFGIKARIEQLLTVELEKMYDDKVINDEEALTKVELQALFGLSYEDFYEIDKKIAQKAIKNGANMKDLGSYFDV